MFQVARWRVILVTVVALLGILFALPNALPKSVLDSLPGWVPAKQLNLGIDLRGGSYLQLEADVEAYKRERVTNIVEDIRSTLETEQIAYSGPVASDDRITVTLTDPARLDTAYRVINNIIGLPIPGQVPEMTLARAGGNQLVITFRPEGVDAAISEAVTRSIGVIRRRIDPEGNKEIPITKQGIDRIVVQAPGDDNPEELVRLIEAVARLTFHMVDDSMSAEQAMAEGLPPGSMLVPGAKPGDPPELVRRRSPLGGEMLTDASLSTQQGQYVVAFRFNGEGAKIFGDLTSNNVGKRFAAVLDGRVVSAPVINGPITGGSGIIEGGFTAQSAGETARLLDAGALPINLTVIERRSVTAELGADAVAAGMTATFAAFIMVLVFMVLAYGFLFGGISVVALLVNGALLIAAMSTFGAALTLPGIAGLILTLAMAVDANVLIYERMRDEIRSGKNVISSMESGFGRAMVTILDANLTTLIAAIIMFIFGEGPVKGFAWTLTIGLFTSVFTAVFITQVLLAFWFRAVRPKTLPIAH